MRRIFNYTPYFRLLLLLFTSGISHLFAQDNKYSNAVENSIYQVEHNVGSWVRADGIPNPTLRERMKFHNVNGVSIAVIKNYTIEWVRGFGWADKAEHRPVTTSTLFQAGSISKSVNAVGVLKLVQDGKLNLYADINNYLTTWKFPYDSLSGGNKITTANLLSHTAGLTVHGFPGYEIGDSLPSLIQVLDGKRPANTSPVRSAFEPSRKYRYSGGGTTISQLMIEDISGEPYAEFMKKNVLDRLDMNSSFFTQPPAKAKKFLVATAYYNNGKEVKGKYHIYPEQAAAGLWTNPTDLAKYIIETQLSLLGRSNKLLSPETTKTQLSPYIDSVAALGVFINKKGGKTYFSHGGKDEGFVSQYYGSLDSGNGVVIMANTFNTAILVEIANRIADVYNWKGFYTPKIKKLMKPAIEILETYTGKYTFRNDTVSITKLNDTLFWKAGTSKRKLYFTSETDFLMLEAKDAEIKFLKDIHNKVEGFYFKQGSLKVKAIKLD